MGFQIFMFGLGLILLVWGSSLFVDSAIALANHLHLPEVLIGATVVSLGTTLPEILFSTISAARGLTDMALGNALGSILCNTGLIAGFLILLKPVLLSPAETNNVILGALFLGNGFLIYFLSGIIWNGLPRFVGILLLCICVLYLGNTAIKTAGGTSCSAGNSQRFGLSDTIRLFLEVIAVYTGASLLVKFGPLLARSFGVPEFIISLTLVALGTSLPELVTSFVSLMKRHSSLSLGNIIGADVLNFLLVGGASASIYPIGYPQNIMRLELPFTALLLSLLCVPSIRNKKAGRLQGLLLLLGYAGYLWLMLKG